jgi:O-methyltransferase
MLGSLLQKCANRFGYEILPATFRADPVLTSELTPLLEKCWKFTLTGKERLYALQKAVQYLTKAGIEGDFVECGVWKGGSIMAMALTLMDLGVTDRKIFLYDTFAGMSKPTDEDREFRKKDSSAKERWVERQNGDHVDWEYSSLSEVKENVYSTGYPKDNFVFVEGKVEDTIPKVMPSKIALLRLDTDFYESTKHEFEFLFPALVPKGVLILDDYGWWEGVKKATDEYLSANNVPILLNRIDSSSRIGIKM